MSDEIIVRATHKVIATYYEDLERYADQDVTHELAVRSAFQTLLADTARRIGWTLIPEQSYRTNGKTVYPDGTLRDQWQLPHGYWEAKDSADDLDAEIRKKREAGYPFNNIIFEDTREGVLFQRGLEVQRADLTQPDELADLLNLFLSYSEPNIEHFERAVEQFQEHIPQLATGLNARIKEAHRDNRAFQDAFEAFFALCREALNPNLSRDAVDEMLIQHLLTERLLRTVFDMSHFVQRNIIAAEVEEVIEALTSQSFNRRDFLGQLDRFYVAIEDAAHDLTEFSEKQHFLNTIYEQFFQGYSVKVADTHGIVYTPQEIVDFMCAAVEEVLEGEFGLTLGDEGVNMLDPCTGTGNFIVNLLNRVPARNLERAYREQLFANEVMLLPYYIAALNIEHEYYEKTGRYEAFEGLCFVDTLDLAEGRQLPMFVEKNTARVEREKRTPITVIIGNPPYNSGQLDENDNNKNRAYEVIDQQVSETYARDSNAQLKSKLYDPYIKFFRWATNRLSSRDGIVCFITNNGFVEGIAFDGFRKHLLNDFSRVYHIDLHGDVRQNPKISGTTHNVFGIQVGVGITIAIRSSEHMEHELLYHRVPEFWRKEQKLGWLAHRTSNDPLQSMNWETIPPNEKNIWIVPEHSEEFSEFIALTSGSPLSQAIFRINSLGVTTNRDVWAYGNSESDVSSKMEEHIRNYNYEVFRLSQELKNPRNINEFVNNDPSFLKWTDRLKTELENRRAIEFDGSRIRVAIYRPYTKRYIYFDHLLNQRRYQQPKFFPTHATENENRAIALTDRSLEKPFMALMINVIADLHLTSPGTGAQCFPFYVYDEDGGNRRENITDWALALFRDHYRDESISRWDVFYYVYGVLHHPTYRARYGDNLKRDLPRLPFAPDFWAFADAGRDLAEWHLHYETVEPHQLEWITADDEPMTFEVEKMRLRKPKKAGDPLRVKVNDYLTLAGIPAVVQEYRLGNRSALEWVIDQYRVKTDKRSGIVSDPNNPDDERYIVDLIERVVRVSVETVRIVRALAEYPLLEGTDSAG